MGIYIPNSFDQKKLINPASEMLLFCNPEDCDKLEKKKKKSYNRQALATSIFMAAVFFLGCMVLVLDQKQKAAARIEAEWGIDAVQETTMFESCETPHWRLRNLTLPAGMVAPRTDLEMRPLWGKHEESKETKSLLALAVGIDQMENVNKIVKKFPASGFAVMLFHYDTTMDEWKDFDWIDRAVRVSAINQTKWWCAKSFLHPDVVSDYEYIFLWDDFVPVDNFDAERYLSVIRKKRLEISQPVLETKSYERINQLYRRHLRPKLESFAEMTAPVFSKASWSCAWHVIQVDTTKDIGDTASESDFQY